MANDGRQSEKENDAIELQGLCRYTGGPLALERFEIQNTETKHSCHASIGHEKGKISSGHEEINKERRRQKAKPHEDIGVQGLNGNALFPSLFAIVFVGPGLLIRETQGENRKAIGECQSTNSMDES